MKKLLVISSLIAAFALPSYVQAQPNSHQPTVQQQAHQKKVKKQKVKKAPKPAKKQPKAPR